MRGIISIGSPRRSIGCAFLFAMAVAGGGGGSVSGDLVVQTDGPMTRLCLGSAAPFYETTRPVLGGRSILVENSTIEVITWREQRADGSTVPWYAISPDGVTVPVLRETSYQLKLRYAEFDPAVSQPNVSTALAADANCHVYVVQFVTQPLDEYRAALRARGAKVYNYLPRHSHLVSMTQAVKAQVEALPFVRAITPYHPAYRVPPGLRATLESAPLSSEPERYSILSFGRAATLRQWIVDRIETLGGTVPQSTVSSTWLEAMLSPDQLLQIAAMDEVQFVSPIGEIIYAMNIARDISGASYLASLQSPEVPFAGEGVRGEVMDDGLTTGHLDFVPPPLIHCANRTGTQSVHGTKVYGTVFGNGIHAPIPGASGILPAPQAQGIFATSACAGTMPSQGARFTHASQLVGAGCCGTDPNCPYDAVFQTNSWARLPLDLVYDSTTYEVDDIIFTFDLLMCQSQGNCGDSPPSGQCFLGDPRQSAREAWAKNVVSVGGVAHLDSVCRDDDAWNPGCPNSSQLCPHPDFVCQAGAGSVGPAEDGRVKPDLVHLVDNVLTTCWFPSNCYTDNSIPSLAPFGGTSAATPITAGYFGLLFQMWHEGVFAGFGGGASVFADRPHAATAKAMMINTAFRYPLIQSDFTRDNQGWGMADVKKLYDLRDRLFIVDETHVLTTFSLNRSRDFGVEVAQGEPELLVTMVYRDPPGAPASNRHAVNDLDVRVTSPSGVSYWGNCGLHAGNSSSSTCTRPNPPHPDDPLQPVLDTVENVFIQNPEAGTWIIHVNAAEINEDSNVLYLNNDPTQCCIDPVACKIASPTDAVFSLVANGVSDLWGACCPPSTGCTNTTKTACLQSGGEFKEGFLCGPTQCSGMEE